MKSKKWMIIVLVLLLIVIGIFLYKKWYQSKPDTFNYVENFDEYFLFKGEQTNVYFAFEPSEGGFKGSYALHSGESVVGLNNFTIEGSKPNYTIQYNYRDKKYEADFKGSISRDHIVGELLFSDRFVRKFGLGEKKYNLDLHVHRYTIPDYKERYSKQAFDSVVVHEGITFGSADGYYSEYILEKDGEVDYSKVLASVLKKVAKYTIVDLFSSPNKCELKMDVYEPKGDTIDRRPLLMMIHGGAFLIGHRKTEIIRQIAERKAREGWVVASIDYRLGFNPASGASIQRSAYRAVQDSRAALRYLVHYSNDFKIDTSNIYLGGTSAGAITALNTAFMEQNEAPDVIHKKKWGFKDLGLLDSGTNNYTDRFSIKGILNMWGAVHDTDIVSPEIPVIHFHGDKDRIVPYGVAIPFKNIDETITKHLLDSLCGSQAIHARLQSQGGSTELITYKGKDHEPHIRPEDGTIDQEIMDDINDKSSRFLCEQIQPKFEMEVKEQIGNVPVRFHLNSNKLLDFHFKVQNGILIAHDQSKHEIQVLWFAENDRSIKVLGVNSSKAFQSKEYSY